jgi:hypothetical protein
VLKKSVEDAKLWLNFERYNGRATAALTDLTLPISTAVRGSNRKRLQKRKAINSLGNY